MVFVQRACGDKKSGTIAYSTVACSANVIAVSYQRTGSFRSDPVDTGRAFRKNPLPKQGATPCESKCNVPEVRIGLARCHAQRRHLTLDYESMLGDMQADSLIISCGGNDRLP
jgi:hypothetical protein